jgi:hypothetical protein
MSRCIDHRTCERKRWQHALGIKLVNKTATVETVRRHRVHYFRVVRKYAKNDKGENFLTRVDLELVPSRNRATRFTPNEANVLARAWNAVAREV